MTALTVIGVWVIALVLILLLWDFLKIRHQLDRVEHNLLIIDNTLGRLSTLLLRPDRQSQFGKTMEH